MAFHIATYDASTQWDMNSKATLKYIDDLLNNAINNQYYRKLQIKALKPEHL